MPKYLLDTDICIYFLQGKFGIDQKIKSAGVQNCFVSEITILELLYGAEKSTNFQKHVDEVKKVESLFDVIPIYSSFSIFTKEKVRLRREGRIIPDFDLLIGATAVANHLVMVSNNTKHISRIDGIVLENWRVVS